MPSDPLSRRERQIMDVIYARGQATAAEVTVSSVAMVGRSHVPRRIAMAPTADVRPTPAADLTAVRRVLTAKRAQLAASLGADAPGDLDGIAGTRGETEHLSVSEQRDVDLAIGSMHRKALNEIEQALARLDQGAYGLCVVCQAPIPPERLEAIPEAAVCVRCG